MAGGDSAKYNNRKVLVVDDEEVVRVLFENLLVEEGLEYLPAADAASAVEIVDSQQPALVLVDKNLPDRSGLDLIAELKGRHPQVEFIMITGYASLDSAVKALELGAFSYLTKPFDDIAVVLDRIHAALDVAHLRQETGRLRQRLEDLASSGQQQPRAGSRSSARLLDQVLYTISLLESFRQKRDQPPQAAGWARTVDTLEDAAAQLRRAVESEQDPGEQRS